MDKIRGILIDPHAKAITEIELKKPSLQSFYKAIDCDRIDFLHLEELGSVEHDVVVDDEGMYAENQKFFTVGKHTPYSILAGKGVIVSIDNKGNACSHQLDLEDIKRKVRFLTSFEALEIARDLRI